MSRFPSYRCEGPGIYSSQNPILIHPYYTGRDKGPISHKDGTPMMFFNEGHAWNYIFTVLQPNDLRAMDNYTTRRHH